MSFPRPGVSMDSYSAAATWTSVSGTWSTDYPVTNLGDLRRPTKVGRVVPAGGGLIGISAVLPAAVPIRMIAIVNHNCSAFASLLVRIWSDAGTTTLTYDNGGQTFYPAGPGPDNTYAKVRPLILPAEVQGRHIEIQIGGLTGTTDIGAVEIARFWEWSGVSPGADVGFRPLQSRIDYLGGGSEGVDEPPSRTYDGEMSYLALAIAASQGLDFQKLKGKAEPFVFTEDYSDAASWARTTFLATNAELPASVGAVYRHDRYQFRLKEHMR